MFDKIEQKFRAKKYALTKNKGHQVKKNGKK